MFYLGIDIAKVNHVASLIGEDGTILVRAIKFTNSNEGLQKLLNAICDYDQSQIYCAMEATGTYWLSLFSELTEKGFNVSVFKVEVFISCIFLRFSYNHLLFLLIP